MPVVVKSKDSESESEEYETYEYETETGEEGEEGEEEDGSGEEESGEEESSEDKKKKDDKKDDKKKKEESEEEESEYESEYETESSEEKKDGKKDGKKDDKKEESSEYESEYEYETDEEEGSKEGEESSEYEYETEYESSSEKPKAAAAKDTKDAKTDITQVTKSTGTPAAANNTKAAAPAAAAAPVAAVAVAHTHVVEKALLHDDSKKEGLWSPKRHFAEFVGTFVLCWAIYMTRATLADPFAVPQSGAPVGGLVGVALVHALVYAAMLAAFGRISGGHFNPAVTVTLALIGEVHPGVAVVYIFSQFAGAVLAGALTWGLLPPLQTAIVPGIRYAAPIACAWWDVADVIPDGAMHPDHVCTYQAFGAEIAGTLVVLLAYLIAGIGGYGRVETYVTVGFSLGAAVFATLPISNACLNPARAIGAAIFSHTFNWFDIWVWIIGPAAAVAVAIPLYYGLFSPEAGKKKPAAKPAAAKPAANKK